MKLSDINDFLQFGRQVRITFSGLLAFSFAFLMLPTLYPYILKSSEQTDFFETELAANAIIEKSAAKNSPAKSKGFPHKFNSNSYEQEKKGPPKFFPKKQSKVNQFKETELFTFDPNTVAETDLLKLGFSEKVTRTFLSFRNKGAVFRKKEDLKKVYGISEFDFSILESFISIEDSSLNFSENKFEKSSNSISSKSSEFENIKIDINKATEDEWQKLRGIGPYYANKIVNFRNKLGGFSSIEQIGSTYGLRDSAFQKIKPFLEASPVFQKIKINLASWQELKDHPYIKGKQASIIEKYRKNHGAFADFSAFKKVVAFTEEEFERLSPYLDFAPK